MIRIPAVRGLLMFFDGKPDKKIYDDDKEDFIKKLDRNGDGGISKKEFFIVLADNLYDYLLMDALTDPQDWKKRTAGSKGNFFDLIDLNKDDKIDKSEIDALWNALYGKTEKTKSA